MATAATTSPAPDRAHPDASREEQLRNRAHAFCQALLDPDLDPDAVVREHFASTNPKVTEHGPPWCRERLPFLARTFVGRPGVLEYFDLLGRTLRMQMRPDSFPGPPGFVVDPTAVLSDDGDEGDDEEGAPGVVCVVGKARFASIKTGRAWDEQFIYRLSGFTADGKIGHWEIWADPLSAWAAVGPDE